MPANFTSPDDPCLVQLDLIASPIFVLEADPEGVPRYIAFNLAAREISGRPLSDYLARTAAEVYPGAMGRTALERHCEVARTGQSMAYEIDLPIAGETRTVHTTLIPQKVPGKPGFRLFGTSADLTQQRHTREARVNFDTVVTEMEQFVAMAAHDLRAPIRNMGQIADMLREDFVDHGDGKLELIDMMDQVASKSMTLIADVLDHAHAVEASHSVSRFNFAALCRDICDVIDPHARHRFTYTSAEVEADRTAFQIGLRNLIDNSVKYGGHEGLQIDISLSRGTNGMLDVTLSDSGRGFPEGALAFLNGGGFKVDSGYGLLGVRRMVQARGGSMTAGNQTDGTGAVIRFSLPGTWVTATTSLGDPLGLWRDAEDTGSSTAA